MEHVTCLLWGRIDSSTLVVARMTTWFLGTKCLPPLAAIVTMADKMVVVTVESVVVTVISLLSVGCDRGRDQMLCCDGWKSP